MTCVAYAVPLRHGGFLTASEAAMSTTLSQSRTLRQRTTGNPLDPNDGTASLIKPGELVDVVEMTPLTLVDRRTYNLLLAFAWDRIDEDVEHAIPKAVLRGAHKGPTTRFVNFCSRADQTMNLRRLSVAERLDAGG